MVKKLFESFLDDGDQYRACEEYWNELVGQIAGSLGQTNEWRSWIPRRSPNGMALELDGNPICDGRSEQLERAFRVVQHPPIGDELEIVAILKNYEAEYEELPRSELVLNLSLSEESAALARALLEKWMRPETTQEEMLEFIQDTLPNELESSRV